MSISHDSRKYTYELGFDPELGWGAADIYKKYGNIPVHRIRTKPLPGLATIKDLIKNNDRKTGLCELDDGIMIDKTEYGEHATKFPEKIWGLAKVVRLFGNIPMARIRMDPMPGTATEEDFLRVNDGEDCLCELIDETLVEKTMGAQESALAMRLAFFLSSYLAKNNIGLILGADGFIRFLSKQIRLPDLSFFRWDQFPDNREPEESVWNYIPRLVVEILSKGNPKKEMNKKLADYLKANVPLIWYIDPRKNQVAIYSGNETPIILGVNDILDGGQILPGFQVPLTELFTGRKGPQQ